jgi:hypothetical protein
MLAAIQTVSFVFLSPLQKCKIYIITLSVVLYGHETWSLNLREDHGYRVFESRVLRKIIEHKMEEAARGWRK